MTVYRAFSISTFGRVLIDDIGVQKFFVWGFHPTEWVHIQEFHSKTLLKHVGIIPGMSNSHLVKCYLAYIFDTFFILIIFDDIFDNLRYFSVLLIISEFSIVSGIQNHAESHVRQTYSWKIFSNFEYIFFITKLWM